MSTFWRGNEVSRASGLLILASSSSGMTQPFQPDDLYLYRSITELHCLPNGEVAACVVESISREQDARTSSIWLVPLDGGQPRQFTSGAALDDMPRWSPDGSQLAFLSARINGLRQIHLMRRDGGEALQLSHFPAGGVMSIAWSPDGKRLLASCSIKVDPEARGARRAHTGARAGDAPQLAWRLPYKADGIGYLLDTEVHLFAVDAHSGDHVQLTDGAFEVRSESWSPDGRRIAFTRTRDGRTAHRTDVWIMDADGRNARQVSHDIASVQYPRWSPDGRLLVFTGAAEEGSAQMRLWLYDMERDEIRPLGDQDAEVASGQNVCWSEDGASVMLVTVRRGRHEIVSVSVTDGTQTRHVTGDRQIARMACTAQRLVFVSEDPRTPNELYCTDRAGRHETRLSNFNPWWSERRLPQVEIRQFDVPDGRGGREQVEGWLLLPEDARGPMPLLVDVHGGPASYALVDYRSRMYWRVLVSRGWAVLSLNAVGSSSYGREFCERLRGHWGKYDLDQHLAAVQALQRDGIADDRVAIAGKSYGGYLSAWAIGNTHVFRAAVVAAPVINLETHYGTSDSGYYADTYSMFGEPPMQRERMQQLSPIGHAHHARTPTLILQGEQDQRCPRGQAEQLFVALMCATDTPAELVIYPGGDHHFFESGKPSHRLDAVERLVQWAERWVGVAPGECPMPAAGVS
jgi:dipeptidyl aminopeptidase/acylaminoacyl peptidase